MLSNFAIFVFFYLSEADQGMAKIYQLFKRVQIEEEYSLFLESCLGYRRS